MSSSVVMLGLDVGERRIGVAKGDSLTKMASPLTTLDVDGNEITKIVDMVNSDNIAVVVVGLPRNMSGELTAQSRYVYDFVARLRDVGIRDIELQDESLTSVIAEKTLQSHGKPYFKADVDAMAAALILGDYLEASANASARGM